MSENNTDPAYRTFVSQAERCEQLAANNPGHYRWRVIALAVLGYCFAPAILAILVFGFAALLWEYFSSGHSGGGFVIGKLGFVLAALLILVVRAMQTGFGKTEGTRLKRQDAPEFFRFIDDIRHRAGNPAVHRVYLTDEMNAAVRQTPRLGLLGFHRNELIVGMPLMQTLSKDELAAVIAHEFGHLSGAHGKIGAWIYRTRLMMFRLLESIEESGNQLADWIFGRFYRWFAPYFSAYSFALAREQEYEADRMAADVTSPKTVVDALVRTSMADSLLNEEFWHGVWRRVDQLQRPPENVYAMMGEHLRDPNGWKNRELSFRGVLSQTTGYADTHPSLGDRAKALGVNVEIPAATEISALSLMPEAGQPLIDDLSKKWRSAALEPWTQQHEEMQEHRKRFEALEAEAEKGPLSADDAILRGHLAERFLPPEAALARFEEAIERSKGASAAVFAKGRILLDLGREEGLALLDDLMQRDSDAIVPVCEVVEFFLLRHGREAEAEAYRAKRLPQEEIQNADYIERRQVSREDTFVPHDCNADEVARMVAAVEPYMRAGIVSAYLVRKETAHRKWVPAHFLICCMKSVEKASIAPNDLEHTLAQELADLDSLSVLVCPPSFDWVVAKAREVQDACIITSRPDLTGLELRQARRKQREI